MGRLFRGINVVAISVPDLDAAREFYRDALGLGEPIFDLPEAGWIEFGTGGPGNIAVTRADLCWAPSTATTVVLDTADCYAAATELRARGVQCEEPVELPGFVVHTTFYDPFGNRLQICSDAAVE